MDALLFLSPQLEGVCCTGLDELLEAFCGEHFVLTVSALYLEFPLAVYIFKQKYSFANTFPLLSAEARSSSRTGVSWSPRESPGCSSCSEQARWEARLEEPPGSIQQ